MSSSLATVREALVSSNRILLLSHVRPDGDAIGSQIALALSLRALGKDVKTWNEDGCPGNLRFLEGSALVEPPPAEAEGFDTVVCLDTASKERVGRCLDSIAAANQWINIDHHSSNPGYGDISFIDAAAAATGEIIYDLLVTQDLPIPVASAAALYVAISTDTGSFRYPNVTARTFATAADLLKRGVDAGAVCLRLYESYPRRRAVLLGELLTHARFESKAAAFILDNATKARLGILPEDVDGLIDAIRCVDTVKVAAFFEELADGRVRVSIRSKDPQVDVSTICHEYGGGGHRLAAGARIRGEFPKVVDSVLQRIDRELSQRD
ncbi:MAG: bifunctional oligoribonuclease/PAP phosphatase NrnA [Verrucomicrobia bacterium]|nr:bifunctional oligoribonuclease/PAP phosphatase NrnA [Verrucomicrobiota bacterium]